VTSTLKLTSSLTQVTLTEGLLERKKSQKNSKIRHEKGSGCKQTDTFGKFMFILLYFIKYPMQHFTQGKPKQVLVTQFKMVRQRLLNERKPKFSSVLQPI